MVPVAPDQRVLLNEHRLGLPMVFVDRPAITRDVDSVTTDNREGARLAVGHLARHGHRRIAFLGDLHSIWTAEERYLGYVEGLATEGIRLDARLIRRDMRGIDAACAAATELLGSSEAPSAFFAGQNLLTIGVVRALQVLGLRHRVALIGFDDFTLADLLECTLPESEHHPVLNGTVTYALVQSVACGVGEVGVQHHVPDPGVQRSLADTRGSRARV